MSEAATQNTSSKANVVDNTANGETNREFDSARSFDLTNSAMKPMSAVAMASPDSEK
jgi:hypothetical protein